MVPIIIIPEIDYDENINQNKLSNILNNMDSKLYILICNDLEFIENFSQDLKSQI
jgi:hypothetical protein